MTKKLQELFNLPEDSTQNATSDDVTADEATSQIQEQQDTIHRVDEAIDKIDAALPMVRSLEASDQEMDDLAKLAEDKFKDLMDLGMNVELRYAGDIFGTASNLLGHAITAKTAKMDKKLKMIDLQLKKLRIDKMEAKDGGGDESENAIDGKAIVLDRNTLLAQILSKDSDKK